MWIRLAAVLAIVPFTLLAALVHALPGPARAIDGVAAVERGGLDLPVLRLEFAGGTAVLSGVVPDAVERDAIARQAGAIYGASRVVDLIALAEPLVRR